LSLGKLVEAVLLLMCI